MFFFVYLFTIIQFRLFRSSRFQFSGDGVTVGGASLSFLNPRGILSHPSGGLDQPSVLDPAPPRPRQYYLFHILPWSKGLRVKVSCIEPCLFIRISNRGARLRLLY